MADRPFRIGMPRLRAALVAGVLALSVGAPAIASADTPVFQHTPALKAKAGSPLRIEGELSHADEVKRARIVYRRPGGRSSQAELRSEDGEHWSGAIPADDVVAPAIEYYVVTIDLVGRRHVSFGSESDPVRIEVGAIDRSPDDVPPPDLEDPAAEPLTRPKPKGDEEPRPAPKGEPATKPRDQKMADELALYGAEDVVSLATRHEQAVTDAPAIASSFSEDEMRQLGALLATDVLDAMPGFDVSRDVQGYHRLAVRGLRSAPEVLVLYGGHALNSPYDGKPLFALPTDGLERVEAIRGPGSALYGTGAFLGVVDLVPRRRDEVAASFRAGSFTTLQGAATAGHKWGAFGLYGDASVLTSQGYQAAVDRDLNSADLEKQGLKATDDKAGKTNDKRLTLTAGIEGRLDAAGGKLSLSARGIREDRGALVGLFDAVGPDSRLQWNVGMADLRFDRSVGSGAFSARLYVDGQSTDRLFQITPANPAFTVGGSKTPTGLREQTRFGTRSVGGEVSGEIALHPTNRLDVGLSVAQHQLTSYEYLVDYTISGSTLTLLKDLQPLPGKELLQNDPDIAKRLQGGLYVQDQWRPVEPLSLTLGIRADLIQLPTVDETTKKPTGTRFVPSLNPRLGVVVTALPTLSFKLLYGRAFRAPTMQELSDLSSANDYSSGRETGNPALGPTKVDTVELGAEQLLATSEGKLRLRGNLFWTRVTDPILAVDTSGNAVPLTNRSPGVDVKGAEAEVRFEASTRAHAFFNFSFFRATDLAALAEEFALLTDVPQIRSNLGLVIPVGPWLNLDLLTQLGAERRNTVRSKLEALRRYRIPAYALVTAQLRTEPLWERLEFALTGYNVLQQNYQDDVPRPDRMPGLLPGPGFSALFTGRVRW